MPSRLLGDGQMAGTGDGQKLGDTLDQSQEQRWIYRDISITLLNHRFSIQNVSIARPRGEIPAVFPSAQAVENTQEERLRPLPVLWLCLFHAFPERPWQRPARPLSCCGRSPVPTHRSVEQHLRQEGLVVVRALTRRPSGRPAPGPAGAGPAPAGRSCSPCGVSSTTSSRSAVQQHPMDEGGGGARCRRPDTRRQIPPPWRRPGWRPESRPPPASSPRPSFR